LNQMKPIIAAVLIAVSSAFADWESFDQKQRIVEQYTETQTYIGLANVVMFALRDADRRDYSRSKEYEEWLRVLNNRLHTFEAARGVETYVAPPPGAGALE
jgi:hypothetical protein